LLLALEAEVDINFIRCMGVQYQFIIVLYLNKNAPVKIASYNRLGLHYKTAKPHSHPPTHKHVMLTEVINLQIVMQIALLIILKTEFN
jgi:hypothetical protein